MRGAMALLNHACGGEAPPPPLPRPHRALQAQAGEHLVARADHFGDGLSARSGGGAFTPEVGARNVLEYDSGGEASAPPARRAGRRLQPHAREHLGTRADQLAELG